MPQQAKIRGVFKVAAKIFWGIIFTLFGLLVLLLLWLCIDKFILKSPVPSVFGYSSLTIATGSMDGTSSLVAGKEPKQVGIGDLIVIYKTDDYQIGDVITFLKSGDSIPTTHRIIGYTDGGYVTKGDANNTKDTLPVLHNEVLGEVVGHYPKLGKFSLWVKTEGWIYLVAALAILAIGGLILKGVDDGNPTPPDDSPSNGTNGDVANSTETPDGTNPADSTHSDGTDGTIPTDTNSNGINSADDTVSSCSNDSVGTNPTNPATN